MSLLPAIARLSLAAALLGSMAACTVVPAQPGYYRASPPPTVYYETYPTYRYGPTWYYHDGRHGDRYDRRERDEWRYKERRIDSPLEDAARLHRDTRRSLGLPRLPGMP